MFGRFAKMFRRILPLSIGIATQISINPFLSLNTQINSKYPHSNRINIIKDIAEYAQKEGNADRAILLCELHDDEFIDEQLIQLAYAFQREAGDEVSVEFQFLFVRGEKTQGQEIQNYFVIYSNQGQKVISLDSYLNKDRSQPHLKVNNKPLMKRIVESINGIRQIRISNVAKQMELIQNTNNYASLIVIPDEKNQVQEKLKKYLQQNEIKSKVCQKYVVKDEHSKKILGIGDKQSGVYLLSAVNSHNLLPGVKSSLSTFKIGQKQCFLVPIDTQLEDVFVFPPIQKKIAPEQIVLNVYINKNGYYEEIQQKLMKELSKPQYRKFQKAKYSSSDVKTAALTLQLNDYSLVALKAFDAKEPLKAEEVQHTLGNSHEWSYNIQNKKDIDSEAIQKWIQQSTGPNRMKSQVFKSEKSTGEWATNLTGSEYKEKRDQPGDKIIYHYSQNCHGCKRFGGKFQNFAKNRFQYPGLSFYRINNDHNKAEGVRNYNTTPVFAYYKQNCTVPFVYRMPIFTEDLFEDFLRITGQVSLIDYDKLYRGIEERKDSQAMKQLLSSIKQCEVKM